MLVFVGCKLPMPRPLRVEYTGAIYHLMNRGDRREPVFLDDNDWKTFLGTLGEACEKTTWQVHAYCLMENHFHLVAETPHPNLVAGMKWLLGTYTGGFNRRHQWTEEDLRRECKGHPHKVSLARRLRRETPMTRQWIANRLHIGSASYVSHFVREQGRGSA